MRNYRKEYDNYQGSPEQIARRSNRNKARRLARRKGFLVKGKDIAHKDGNPMNNDPSNIVPQSPSANRSFPRTRKAKKANPKD